MTHLVSISTAARQLEISRPRLSKLIKEFGLKKVRQGTTFLIDLEAARSMLESLEASGRRRPRGAEKATELDSLEIQVEKLWIELRNLQQKLDVRDSKNQQKSTPIQGFRSFFHLLFTPWQ